MDNLRFLNALFANMEDGEATTLHSFLGDPSVNAEGKWYGSPWRRGQRLPVRAGNPFANTYTCVSSFKPDLDGRYYRRKMMFGALHAVMIDDLGTKLPMSDLKLEPSALIETSPGNFQAWLFLAAPIPHIDMAERLIDQMVEKGISAQMDPGMRGVTRVARLPVGKNGKPKYGPKGWTHRIPVFAPERRFLPSQIAQAYGLDLTPVARPAPRMRRSGVDPERAHLVDWLRILELLGKEVREGYHEMICPWIDDHSDRGKSGTYFMEPCEGNSWQGGFNCHHGHCIERDINDLIGFVRARKEGMSDGNSEPERPKASGTRKGGARKAQSGASDSAKSEKQPKRGGSRASGSKVHEGW